MYSKPIRFLISLLFNIRNFSLMLAYYTTLQYDIPRRCMCFTIMGLMWSYPTHPIDKAKFICTDMAFDRLHFFQRPSWRMKLQQPGCCKVNVSKRGNIKVIEVKCQGHFAIYFGQKGTISTMYGIFVLH